jgi:hypothetical protein
VPEIEVETYWTSLPVDLTGYRWDLRYFDRITGFFMIFNSVISILLTLIFSLSRRDKAI